MRVGTPARTFYVVLDTGSADMWLATEPCRGCPRGVQIYSPTASTTTVDMQRSFEVVYGSGEANGELYRDTVSMAGYTVAGQGFAAVNATNGSLLTAPVSGLMGLGFRPIAASRVTPHWQNAGITEFGFALTRFQNDPTATVVEPGGVMVVNGVNATLHTGDVHYVPLISSTFWLISLDAVAVNGQTVSSSALPTAIDTGTTLIGGPTAIVRQIYGAIPGSAPQSGAYEGYYTFPCDADFSVSLTFGGVVYPLASADFNLGPLSSGACLGAIFAIDTAGSASWIVGDSFLKSVYATFRADPPAVGFAPLSPTALALAQTSRQASLVDSVLVVSNSTAAADVVAAKSTAARLFARAPLCVLALFVLARL